MSTLSTAEAARHLAEHDTLPPGLTRRKLIPILAMTTALGPMSIDMYLPSLPALEAHFHSDAATTQQTLASYFVGLSIGQLFYGPVSDSLGRRKPMLFGLILYVIAAFGCLFAREMEHLVALRFLQALGGCAGMVITRAIVRDCFPAQAMARVLSLLLLIMSVAPILAPMAGGYLFRWFGWQSIFALLVVYGLLCAAVVGLGVPETLRGERKPLSLAGAARTYAKLISHRRFMGYALAGATAQAGLFAYISSSSFVFIDHYGIAPEHYAWIFGVNACGLIGASQINSLALNRVPVQRLLRRALRVYVAAGVLMVAATLSGVGGMWSVLAGLFVCMSAMGFSFPNSTAAAMAPFGDRAGSAAALLGTLQFAIASVSSFAAGHLYNGTAVPMAAIIAICGISALLLLRWLAPPPAATA
ncbi:Bcr/CflA family multidrug efflux MFS transporter [Solimonas soli]|uniref:Bcr/CflA family multidrug efflux MFS transporter n=1 Tax=Solimonas soli TaxID=413479 RepID=UPI0004AF2C84|nr:Bcr/CflA family multidrug efflux MFS transporter [Solimonas soli]